MTRTDPRPASGANGSGFPGVNLEVKKCASNENAGLILRLALHPANDRRRYKVTLSFIGWAQTYNQPFNIYGKLSRIPASIICKIALIKYRLKIVQEKYYKYRLPKWYACLKCISEKF